MRPSLFYLLNRWRRRLAYRIHLITMSLDSSLSMENDYRHCICIMKNIISMLSWAWDLALFDLREDLLSQTGTDSHGKFVVVRIKTQFPSDSYPLSSTGDVTSCLTSSTFVWKTGKQVKFEAFVCGTRRSRPRQVGGSM